MGFSTWYTHPLSIITADFLLKSKCSRSNLTSSRAYMECKMLYSRPLSNNSMDRAPRSTPHQTCQPLSDQNMATFTDRNNPFLSQTIDNKLGSRWILSWQNFLSIRLLLKRPGRPHLNIAGLSIPCFHNKHHLTRIHLIPDTWKGIVRCFPFHQASQAIRETRR